MAEMVVSVFASSAEWEGDGEEGPAAKGASCESTTEGQIGEPKGSEFKGGPRRSAVKGVPGGSVFKGGPGGPVTEGGPGGPVAEGGPGGPVAEGGPGEPAAEEGHNAEGTCLYIACLSG